MARLYRAERYYQDQAGNPVDVTLLGLCETETEAVTLCAEADATERHDMDTAAMRGGDYGVRVRHGSRTVHDWYCPADAADYLIELEGVKS